MAINNEPQWCDVKITGERTGYEYFGRFRIKPYLTNEERGDAVRLAERYCRGIDRTDDEIDFQTLLAFLKFHVTEADADWWTADGKEMFDRQPIYEIASKLYDMQYRPKVADKGTP